MPPFKALHIFPLFCASALTFGSMIPFFRPHHAIREFGLPERIAVSQPAQASFVISGARGSVIGMAMWIFYLQGKLKAVA
ncbi:hypothetical protein B0H16DRAFT_1496820 [Mycena metata]|uniref:Uncharacterized protein n=1 Tax=Mycena metata TaxID=1033252 RepID=A0AAD7NZ35_9AGAR|nr:hypothetical protein B0H16DRAFT_1496820 [Mycena metata]